MTGANADWLIVIDMQHVFGDPASPWFTAGFAAAAERIGALLPRFAPRVVFTRFVPPETIDGSWTAYYRRWEFATAPAHAEQWQLVPPWRGSASLDTHRFSKWGVELRNRIGPSAAVVLCGVSTDCCVLMTALAAVDDGAFVRIVADACGAKTQQVHEDALALLQTRAPQLTITSTADELLCG
jgi:nicotinamidase-related amidase